MNRKLIIIIIIAAVVLFAALLILYLGNQGRQDNNESSPVIGNTELTLYNLDLNCNLKDVPPQLTDKCKNYKDAQFLRESCFLPDLTQELQTRCSSYFCAQRRNAGISCE